MKVAVLPNLDKRGCAETVDSIGKLMQSLGIEAYLPESICGSYFLHASEEELYKIADVIITVGGDGTIMRYAKVAATYNKPVIGINAGRMGFLANIEPSEVELLSKLKTGEYTTEQRMLLDIKVVENGKEVGSFSALNDAVITCGFMSRIIDISVCVENDSINYRADGMIVSTPTGSTAYSMSAGGPIVDPNVENMTVTPICSHSLTARPIILGGDRVVKLKAFSKKRTEIFLSIDGRKSFTIKPYTEIYVTKSQNSVKLIRLNDRSFYKTLSMKFREH
jgi:NAD+ kinase